MASYGSSNDSPLLPRHLLIAAVMAFSISPPQLRKRMGVGVLAGRH